MGCRFVFLPDVSLLPFVKEPTREHVAQYLSHLPPFFGTFAITSRRFESTAADFWCNDEGHTIRPVMEVYSYIEAAITSSKSQNAEQSKKNVSFKFHVNGEAASCV